MGERELERLLVGERDGDCDLVGDRALDGVRDLEGLMGVSWPGYFSVWPSLKRK